MSICRPQKFSCCLTGSTRFTILCGQVLISAGHTLAVVVSSSPEVAEWAAQKGVPFMPDFDTLLATGSPATFDYLISAINGVILPADVLQLPRRAAVNYHNGPLPRYAGVHAASWAILNGEKVHGVTWHEMVERIDAGPIYAQRTFSIDGMATAWEVNEACRATGLELFRDLISQFEAESLRPVPQDLTQRTYYSGNRKHPSGGLISWRCDAATIARLVGAHQMGSVVNTLGSAKLDLGGGRSAIVSAAAESPSQSTSSPGTVVTASGSCLRVATKTNDINLIGITDFSGHEMTSDGDDSSALPSPGRVLPTVAPALAEDLAKRLEMLSADESFCAHVLKTADRTTLPLGTSASARPRVNATVDFSCATAPDDLLDLLMLSATVLAVREFSGWNRISVEHRAELTSQEAAFGAYLSRGLPVTVTFDAQTTETDVMQQIGRQIARARGRDTFARDIALRRQIPLTEFPIRAGLWPLSEDDIAGAQLGVILDAKSGRLRLVSDRGPTWHAYTQRALRTFGLRVRRWARDLRPTG